jgi:hypothetical protein
MPDYDEVILPQGLTDKNDADSIRGRDRYKLVTDEDIQQAGNVVEGFNYPVIQVPSATELASHGGSMGFDSSKPFAVLMDPKNSGFVMDDITSMPKELINQISKEAEQEILAGGSQANPGKVLSRILRKYLAATHIDGPALNHLSTWVNDGHDPFRQDVKLPPPIALHSLIKKGKTMQPGQPPQYFATPSPIGNRHPVSHPGMTPAGHANMGHQTGFPPGTPMAGNRHHSANMQQPQVQAPPPVSQLPPPSQVVSFSMPGGNIKSKYHVAKIVEQEWQDGRDTRVIQYILLVRNGAAPGTDDQFTPVTPAPGSELWVTMPDGSGHQVYNVAVSYNIGTVNHTLLMIQPPMQIEQQNGGWNPEAGVDPIGQLGEPAPQMSEEEAAMGV